MNKFKGSYFLMDEKFQKTLNLCLIYSKDLTKMLVKKCKHQKLDGLLINSENAGMDQVQISKVIHDELGLEIPPTRWQIVTTLQNIERKWKIDVYLTYSEIETIKNENFELINPLDLPENIHPNLRWLIPLSIDFTVFGSSFNQILMK